MQDDPGAHQPPPLPAEDGTSSGAVWSEVAEASPLRDDGGPDPRICPFLRSIDEGGDLGVALGTPDPANRCAALAAPVPQSLRQQELVCLTTGHVNCPRYLRGAQIASHLPAGEPSTRVLTPATAVALLVFAGAFMLSLAFVVTNGGLQIVAAAPGPSASGGALGAAVTATPTAAVAAAPTAAVTATPTAAVTATPTAAVTATPTAAVTATPTAATPQATTLLATATPAPTSSPTTSTTPIPTPVPTPVPTAAPTPRPSSNRYALLKPCPDKPNCWIYTIRSGDNLYSIANYFGIPLSTIQSLNPWTKTSGLKAGRQLRLPPPTR